jgi:dienelactone hydrolase
MTLNSLLLPLALATSTQQAGIKPLPDASTVREWQAARKRLAAEWEAILGGPVAKPPPAKLEVLEEEMLPTVIRRRVRYQTEPDVWTEAYLLLPRERRGRVPGVVVFHSTTPIHIRQPAGLEGPEDVHIGLRLAERGFVTLSPRCYIFDDPTDKYAKPVDALKQRQPGWTGMRKMLWDGQRALDVLASLPDVDKNRMGAIGHSLGAKETLYLAAFDPRVKAAVFSEGGVGMASTNWEAPWYVGDQVKRPEFGHDHHELLALVAPRPFLVLGGDSADGEISRPFVEAAVKVFRLYGVEERLRLVNHKKGHSFPSEAQIEAYGWLEKYLL